MSTHCFIVTGYNNVRIYDVEKMRQAAMKHFDARLVLVTERANDLDALFADWVIEAPFDMQQGEASLAHVLANLQCHQLQPIGILPFSDRGVPLGARLAQHFGLPGATPEEALAGLDKRLFRQLDSQALSHPAGYRPLSSQQVASLPALQQEVARLGGKAFLKPAQEGNSRGCQVIGQQGECARAWAAVAPYHGGGIIVESLVEGAREYSWDCVAGQQWITEKHTTEGLYRAEYQQIVPAPLPPEEARRLLAAGAHMQSLVSARHGAWHNEIFLLPDATAAVETNMRPAGMHIWDLAHLSFEGFDPWLMWLRWATDGQPVAQPLRPRGYAGIRMLRAPRAGRLLALPEMEALACEAGIALHQGQFSAQLGDRVGAEVQSNADFVGHIILTHPDYPQLLASLAQLATRIEQALTIA